MKKPVHVPDNHPPRQELCNAADDVLMEHMGFSGGYGAKFQCFS